MHSFTRLISGLCVAVSLSVSAQAAQDKPEARLHLVGDSTMSDKPNLSYPERGWGQLLPEFLLPKLEVVNHAKNGRSTRRFVNEGRWQSLITSLKEGEYVLIQFGHNDQKKSDPARYASPDKDYPAYLHQFIDEVRAKGGIPMIASSICRRNFDDKGNLKRDLQAYADAAEKVAKEANVAYFDMQAMTCNYIEELGKDAAQPYFIQVPADLYEKHPDGKTDNTHLTVQGASRVAQFFIRDLKKQGHPLAKFVYREHL